MLRLHIVRHGQTSWNAIRRVQGQSDSELDDTGKQQAADLREELSDIDFAAVFVSPLLRTRQTADILCAHRNNDHHYLDDLKEMGLGQWETHMWDDVAQKWPEQHKMYTDAPDKFDMPGAETAHVLSQRGARAIEHIHSQVSSGDVLVVSHGVLIKTIILGVARQPLSVLWEEPHLHNCCRSVLQIDNNAQASWLSVADMPVEDVNWSV